MIAARFLVAAPWLIASDVLRAVGLIIYYGDERERGTE